MNSSEAGYKCIFFDLDHTLWDYESNSTETLTELFARYELLNCGIPDAESFCSSFDVVNRWLWEQYDTGQIGSEVIRNERFGHILKKFDLVNDDLCKKLSADYLAECPKRDKVMPFAIETLDYLADRYSLTVITNGFEETQYLKLRSAGIDHYFDHIITSQRAGVKKPHRDIFDLALRLNRAMPHEAVMIGDNLITDIGGARASAIKAILYNPNKLSFPETDDHEIHCLSDLKKLL